MHRAMGWGLGLVMVLVGCAAPPAANTTSAVEPPRAPSQSGPKRITLAIPGLPAVLDSRFDTSTNKIGYVELQNVYNSKLNAYDNTGTMIPQLAENVPSLENGGWILRADGTMETRWTIKAGVTWHDGTPHTTRDLIFTDEIYRDRSLPQSVSTTLVYLDRLEAVDERTVIAHWKQPFIQADQLYVVFPSLPAHVLEKTYREAKDTFLNHPYFTSEFIGTGPFKLKSFEPATSLQLTAFESYVVGRPKIDEIEVKFIPDINTLITNVVAGAVDLTMARGISTEQAVQLKNTWAGGKVDITNNNWIYMYGQYIDPNPAIVSDVRFHRALLYGINRQEMVDTLQYGYGGVPHVPLEMSHPRYQEILARVPRYDYDPARATQLLQELGYTRAADGQLRNAAGQPLGTVEIRAGTTVEAQIKSMGVVANYLRQLGMEVSESPTSVTMAADRAYRSTFPGLEISRIGYGEDAFVGMYHSSKIPTPANNYTIGNNPRYKNDQWDSLVDRYSVTIANDERMRVMSDLIYHLMDQLPLMPLFFDTSNVLVSARLQNAGAHHGGQRGTQGWNAETWDVK